MLLYKVIQKMNSPEDRRKLKRLLLDLEFYEELEYDAEENWFMLKSEIQLGRTPKLDQKQI